MLFGIDAASYQGAVVWDTIAKSCAFGFEKVTQGTSYENPYWGTASKQLSDLAKTDKFVPGAYLFLEHGNVTAQVDFFVNKLGAVDPYEFLIAIDAEPAAGSNPTQGDLNEATARLRSLLPHHPLIGYCPQWYWGSQPLVQFDVLWSSKYVSGHGTPEEIYATVPLSYWSAYGNRSVALLQFSESATVSGVSGTVDVSAFRGALVQLQDLTHVSTPVTPTPVPVPTPGGSDMLLFDQPKNKQIVIPVLSGQTKLEFYAAQEPGATPAAIQVVCGPGEERLDATPTWNHPFTIMLPAKTSAVALSRLDNGDTPVTVTIS